jgi:3-deoxy-D-manno-octulosonic-acid transferase
MNFWLYQVIYVFGIAVAGVLSLFFEKVKTGLRGRRGLKFRVRQFREKYPASAPVWFHVASSGELEQCLPVMDYIKRTSPEQTIFLSYFSPTAAAALLKERRRREMAGLPESWDAADYAPFDFVWAAEGFVETLKPRALVCVHREIWPGIIRACRRRGIKLALIAAYFPDSATGRLKWLAPWLVNFDFIGTTGTATTNRVRQWISANPPLIESVGDPRIERVESRKLMRKRPDWLNYFDRPVLMISSVWDEDFEAISGGLDRLLREEPSWRIVVAPHEPTEGRVSELLAFFQNHLVPVRLWSEWHQTPDYESHLIFDQVGQLAELYEVATVVFVGGSFRRRVHNVLEPAAYAKPVITGPFIENSGEAVEMLAEGALIKTHNESEFSKALLELVRSEAHRQELGRKLSQYLTARKGASERYGAMILGAS